MTIAIDHEQCSALSCIPVTEGVGDHSVVAVGSNVSSNMNGHDDVPSNGVVLATDDDGELVQSDPLNQESHFRVDSCNTFNAEQVTKDYGLCFRCLDVLSFGYLSQSARFLPRTFAFLTGVVLPLFLLILLSYFFGWLLACIESSGELSRNDEIIQAHSRLNKRFGIFSSILASFPRICTEIYKRNQTVDWFLGEIFVKLANATTEWNVDMIKTVNAHWNDSLTLMNDSYALANVSVKDISEHMDTCSEDLVPFSDFLLQQVAQVAVSTAGETLSFAWNRCPSVENMTEGSASTNFSNTDWYRHSPQGTYYVLQWQQHQQMLYHQYLAEIEQFFNESDGENALRSPLFATQNSTLMEKMFQLNAHDLSVVYATGRKGCKLNLHASVWFWFTVMTTVGYGNQTPVTTSGRILMYSFGFLSILIFGAILGQAGSIVTTIVDDMFARIRCLHWVRSARVSCLLWGLITFLWMFVIAAQYVQYRHRRLDDYDFSIRDGYWFAYISTLTVGLGDYYLDPEVLTASDLVAFPLSFLIGFTFFSGFLGYFSQSVSSPFNSTKILTDNLNTPKVQDQCKPNVVE